MQLIFASQSRARVLANNNAAVMRKRGEKATPKAKEGGMIGRHGKGFEPLLS